MYIEVTFLRLSHHFFTPTLLTNIKTSENQKYGEHDGDDDDDEYGEGDHGDNENGDGENTMTDTATKRSI